MKYERPEDMPVWRVGEFISSSSPGKRVLMIAVGKEEIASYGAHRDFVRWASPQCDLAGMPPVNVPEPFVVNHYVGTQRPVIKGNGFDGLEIGADREETQEFVDWLNERFATARFSRGALRYEWLKKHMTQTVKDDAQLGTFVNLSFMEPGTDDLDSAVDKRMGDYVGEPPAASAAQAFGQPDIQVLLRALESISKRLPTDNPDYTAASCGDTARNALAMYRAAAGAEPRDPMP